MTEFRVRMREARDRLGISQETLARDVSALGFSCHQATIWKIETGTRRLLLDEAVAIAKVLGISLDDDSDDIWQGRALDAERRLADIGKTLRDLIDLANGNPQL